VQNAVAIDRQLRTLREGLMRVRLVPIGEIFRRMPFVVRDLARETGKRVSLLLHGQATEIDKYLIERMMDPVLHLVRNAVSHGIEPPDERVAAGKRPEGTITLSASAARLVTIEIADDGRGVNAADVAERARRAGLDVPDGSLDGTALLALLCAPGFSTKDATDRASGRGVGMAVVKETVERLSGTLTVETGSGTGTRFTIQLPLTLAIADALIARVGSETFAVPQSVVREVIEVSLADVRRIEGNENGIARSLPIVRLGRLFGIERELAPRFHAFVSRRRQCHRRRRRPIGRRRRCGRSSTAGARRGISGATDLGDSRVVLILDPPITLARVVRQRAARTLGAVATWNSVRAWVVTEAAGMDATSSSALRAWLRVADARRAAHRNGRSGDAGPNAAPFVDGVVFSRGQVVPGRQSSEPLRLRTADVRTRLIVVMRMDVTSVSSWTGTRIPAPPPSAVTPESLTGIEQPLRRGVRQSAAG
jgi:two-component system chemotaxis sensor kinase CheA